MTGAAGRRLRPLVCVACFAPLMAEGIASALDGVADVRVLPARLDDLATLLHALGPDAIVVDGECAAARTYADALDLPLFVAPVENAAGEAPTPDGLRALVVESLLAGPVRP